MPETISNMTDHDLLQRLDQKVDGITELIKSRGVDEDARISQLEKDKADRTEMDRLQRDVDEKVENRLKFLEDSSIKLWQSNSNAKVTLTLYSVALGTLIVWLLYYISGVKG